MEKNLKNFIYIYVIYIYSVYTHIYVNKTLSLLFTESLQINYIQHKMLIKETKRKPHIIGEKIDSCRQV